MSHVINISNLNIASAQLSPSHASQPNENSQCSHFVRRLITALVLLFVLISAVNLIVWLIVHPSRPVFTVTSFTVSNLTLSNNNDLRIKADFHFVFSLKNPNKKFNLVVDSFEIQLLYKKDTVLTEAGIVGAVYLEKMSQQNWSPELSRDLCKPLHGGEFNEISKDWSKREISFNVQMMIKTRYAYGIWVPRTKPMKVSCINLAVEFSKPQGINGKLRDPGRKDCSVHLA